MLTPHQQRALSTGYHLTVTANAGSGKTRVLVERYLSIVLSSLAEVSEVVALTYTDKAASELKRKIADQVAAALATSTDPRQTHRLEQVREQLPAAFIGTIHSFCSRILREHPVEGGVDAAFSVIEGLDQHLMLQEAMKDTFIAILKGSEAGAGKEQFVEAVRILGKPRVVHTIAMLIEKRERLERITARAGPYGQPNILDFWRMELQRAVGQELKSAPFVRAMDAVVAASDGKQAAEIRKLHSAAIVQMDPRQRIEEIHGLLQKILRKDGGLYKTVASAGTEAGLRESTSLLARVRDLVEPLLPVLDGRADGAQGELLSVTRTLLGVAQQCLERYELKKLDAGKLDFEDLQLKTRALLQREEVRSHLAARFKFIMVDEYQDTNELQYELLRPLVSNLEGGNLFIVGDPKQSIYGFRDANVAVFDRTRQDIAAHNAAHGNNGQVILGESFRPLGDLAAFVNLLFGRIMGEAEGVKSEYDVGYEPLVRARANGAAGRVELLMPAPEGEPGTPEPEQIAHRIRNLVGSRHEVFGADEQPHDVRFRDIAVLLRSRTFLPDLESAFSRAGVPYTVTGGVGYFQTQDILDFYNYLRFVQHPADDVALAGILRSPFFSVSDIALFESTGRHRLGTLWGHLLSLRRTGALAPALSDAVTALEKDLILGLRLPVPELISRIIETKLVLAKISGTPGAAQSLANLEKLQRMARTFDMQGFTTLFDFTERLRRLINEEEDEGQGTIESQTDSVQIMTVHAAKGLEFPVVVLPTLERRIQFDREPFLHDRLGIGLARISQDGDAEDYPLTNYLREESRRRTLAEEKRIFYVGCTRARDMLILSGNHGIKRSTPGWMAWLLNALGAPDPLGGDQLTFECSTKVLQNVDGAFRSAEESRTLTIHLIKADTQVHGTETARPAAGAAFPILSVDPLPAQWKGEIFSATRIRTYRECPAQYYLKYVLGMPAGGVMTARSDDDELRDREYPAELRGRVFHSVMQNIERILTSGGTLEREIRKFLLLERPADQSRSDSFVGEIAAAVTAVTDSPFWSLVRSGNDTRTEFTISSVIGEDYLSGTIDRVYRDAGGVWHVLDFKTDQVVESSLEKKAGMYWPQLEFYALLVHRFFNTPSVVAEVLFSELPDNPLQRTYTSASLRNVEEEVALTIGKIKAGDFRPANPPCETCPFTTGCPWPKP